MSLSVKNILYIGHNVELVETLLTSLTDGNSNVSYNITHMVSTNEILAILAEKNYHYFITEKPIHQVLSDRIQDLFPQLHATYLSTAKPITEKRHTPSIKELVSEEVQKALNCISIPIYYKNKKGKILACNRSFAHHLGLTVEGVVGKSAIDILPMKLREGIAIVDARMFDDHQVHLYECELHDANGRRHEVVFRKELIEGSDIQIGMVFDISELNEAKRSIEKERMMLRATTDISSDLIFFKGLDSEFLGCNKQFEKFIGQAEKDILGKKDDDFFELEQALMCQAQDQAVMRENKVHAGEEYLNYVNGEQHFIDMRKVPLLNKKGDVQGLIGIGRDITAQHRLQKRLKVADAVFENIQENIVVTDQAGKIISVNQATCQLMGYKKSELIGNHITMLSPLEMNATLHQEIEQELLANKQWKGDLTYSNKLQESRFAWLDIYLVELEKGLNNRIYSLTDLSQNKNIERKIQFLAKHDPLTGLANRIALFTKLEDAIHRANFNNVAMAVILIDINGFKAINDQYGHNVGDKVLREIATRLKNCIFEKDTVARFGDDEFIIIVDGLNNELDAALVAQKVADQFSYKFKIADIEARLSATIGISLCPDDGMDVDTLLLNAEKAMLRAKSDKTESYHFYTDQLTQYSSSQLQLEKELRNALIEDQFELYYQPQYDLNKKLIVGMESLLRWNHPEHGLLLPERFLSLAEESELLVPIGLSILKKVALQTVAWRKLNINFGRITVSMSEVQLEQISLISDIQSIIRETGCSTQDIEFEISEGTFAGENSIIYDNLFNIKKLGISMTVDNFGTNVPTFHFLESLGIEKFKIAKNYVQNVPGHLVGQAMIKSVMLLARELGINVVGDSLENTEQDAFFSANHAETEQIKPMKANEAAFHLRCHKKK